MSGFENLCVFKADHLDIGEFLHWFLQTGNISPRKRRPFSIPKLPIWVGSQALWIPKTPCHCPPHLKFLSSIIPHSSRLNNAPHSDLHHLCSKAASTDQKDSGGCYLRLYLDSYTPASQAPSIVTSQILGTPIPCRPLGFGGVSPPPPSR